MLVSKHFMALRNWWYWGLNGYNLRDISVSATLEFAVRWMVLSLSWSVFPALSRGIPPAVFVLCPRAMNASLAPIPPACKCYLSRVILVFCPTLGSQWYYKVLLFTCFILGTLGRAQIFGDSEVGWCFRSGTLVFLSEKWSLIRDVH